MPFNNKKDRSFIRLKDRYFLVIVRKYFRAWRKEVYDCMKAGEPLGLWLTLFKKFVLEPTRYFTPANMVSLMRGLLAFPMYQLLWAEYYISGVVVYLVGLLTDFIDGHLARGLSQESDVGKLADPAFDKVLNFTALLYVYNRGWINGWLFLAIIVPDILLFLSVPILKVIEIFFGIHRPIGANNYGKWKFFYQCISFVCFLFSGLISPNSTWTFIFKAAGFALSGLAITYAIASLTEHCFPGLVKKIIKPIPFPRLFNKAPT